MGSILANIRASYQSSCIKSVLFVERHANVFLLFAGTALLLGGLHDLSFAQVEYVGGTGYEVVENDQHGALYKMLQGAFGSLIMVVAGLGALVSAAMGSYKAAVGMLIVAGAAFCIRAMVNVTMGYDQIRYTNATQ